MRWTVGAAVAGLVVAGCGEASSRAPSDTGTVAGGASQRKVAAADSASTARRTVVFFGTSLTAGLGLDPEQAYPALVQEKVDSAGLPFDLVNAGVSGETSAGALRRVDWVSSRPADVFVLETGANDGLRGLDVDTLRSNLEQIIARMRRAHPAARIVLVQMEAPPNLGPRYTRRFHEVFPEVARATGVELAPFLLAGVAGNPDLNQGDGIHPNLTGERIVAAHVWQWLRPILVAETQAPAAPAAAAAGSR